MTRRRVLIALCGVVLTLLTVAAWQLRFERAGPNPDTRLGPDFTGWTVKAGERIEREDGTWTLSPPVGEARASAQTLLPGLENLRFVRVRFEAAWENVSRLDGKSWWSARVSLAGKNKDGGFNWPDDGDLVNAVGTRGWHVVEVVLDLPPRMGEPHLFFNNLAATGTLKVRNLTVTPVRQRPWVPAATVALLVAWAGWIATIIGREKGRPRQLAATLALAVAGWYLVFPQPNFHARPFPGGFVLGGESPAPRVVESPPAPAVVPAPPAPAVSPSPVPAPKASPPTPVAETRTLHETASYFRKIDRDLPFAHVAAFLGIGLAVFTMAGIRHGWLPATGIAMLSEVVPNLLRNEFMRDDAIDLAANLVGLALAAWIVWAVGGLRHRKVPAVLAG